MSQREPIRGQDIGFSLSKTGLMFFLQKLLVLMFVQMICMSSAISSQNGEQGCFHPLRVLSQQVYNLSLEDYPKNIFFRGMFKIFRLLFIIKNF